jgi:hypothetical protein
MLDKLFRKLKWWAAAQKSPTIKTSLSKENKELKNIINSKSQSIPPEMWEKMPDNLKKTIKEAQKDGAAIWYKPPISAEEYKARFGNKLPLFPTMLGNTVTIFYGPLMSQTYSVYGGACLMMS